MSFKKIILSCGIVFYSLNAISQGDVTSYSPGVSSEGVTYFLPKTSLVVSIKVKKTTYSPGEFCRYAERYLRINNVVNHHDEYWEISDVNISSSSIPDPDCMYTIIFGNKEAKPSVELTSDGIISTINARSEYNNKVSIDSSDNKETAVAERLNPQDYLTEEILLASSSAKMAELTAKEIYDIRESKNAITRGQAENMPKDGESLKYILDLLDKQEKALMQLFIGETTTEEYTFQTNVDPTYESKKEMLYRFSRKLGLLPTDNLAGSPISIEIEDLHYLPVANATENTEDLMTKIKTTKLSKTSASSLLYYRIPGKATVRIIDNNKCYFEKNLQIAQFGNTERLSSTLFPKGSNTEVVFDTQSGNLISIKK